MPLTSKLLRDDEELQLCLVSDPHHVVPGARGEHVGLIQKALIALGAGVIAPDEIADQRYGPTTAQTVLAFKGPPRNILNTALGQVTPDNIVGKKTIAALDRELVLLQDRPAPVLSLFVALTRDGSPHDHSTCPVDAAGVLVDHLATAINPGLGRKINIGGDGELQYLGFEDVVTDPNVIGGPPRPMTDTIPAATVTDVALRSSPITPRGEVEIARIAASQARLTIATNSFTVPHMEGVIQRLGGVVIERLSIPDPEAADGLGLQVFVVVLPPRF